ncbi:MAG: glucan biosynthesis glucosyltransferase H [Betaproteobacteria bacterium 13_1_40CM_4_64_4]|nr:MAG: glucan biosynthesis glucosyltransferase H [Betaproteobacteria bacterium 13_1_40CM_4_64_4]
MTDVSAAHPENRRAAPEGCVCYLDRLPLTVDERRELQLRIDAAPGSVAAGAQEAFAALHGFLAGPAVNSEDPARGSISRRLEFAAGRAAPLVRDAQGRVRLPTVPPLARTSMVPPPWSRAFGRLVGRRGHPHGTRANAAPPTSADSTTSPDSLGHWHAAGSFRRVVLLGLVVAQTYVATNFMIAVLPYHGRQPLEIAMLALFAILFGWISAGFWTAIAGFVLQVLGGDRYSISRTASVVAPIDANARAAVVMPIRNEDVARVFAGVRAIYESVARAQGLAYFDFFVLSDTSDPNTRVAEIDAWHALCRGVDGFGRIFYRWRQHRIKRKSGNIADFCRRWGQNYRYMVVMDADSVMSGECLMQLLRLMEANPGAGIIQTAPRAVGRETLYARMQQFATRVYGPLFTAGLHFWQLGESHYWGHNAIIRVAPFMRHCALRRLPGRGSLSGEILSHDFVEAALMRRAGWAVWIAYDLRGSYEEMPPNLVDELSRDRRWCQGNLMNFRLFLLKGLHVAHRAVFMSGVMAYVSALLWFLFLILSTALLAVHTLSEPTYFLQPYQLFPLWPEWHPEWAIALFGATALLLFLPKILSVLAVSASGATRFGGTLRLAMSVAGEIALSALLAPIRMLFHTRFVLLAFLGWNLQWKSPRRGDAETTWREALSRHGPQTLLGVLWAGGVYWLNPAFLWWLLPVAGALIVSIPVSVYTSRVALGRRFRAAGMFVIPEELQPPEEIRATIIATRDAPRPKHFIDAVVDPVTNALVCATRIPRARQTETSRRERSQLLCAALIGGPDALTETQKMRIMGDPDTLSELHAAVWTSAEAHPCWRAIGSVPAATPHERADMRVALDTA